MIEKMQIIKFFLAIMKKISFLDSTIDPFTNSFVLKSTKSFAMWKIVVVIIISWEYSKVKKLISKGILKA